MPRAALFNRNNGNGIEAHRSTDGTVKPNITIANYERLHYFDPDDFAGVVCDESSILKNFDGVTKAAVVEFLRKLPYRLLCTATAAPNDYIELGTSSEALGGLGYMDMLGMFFRNDQNSLHPSYMGNGWRFKAHAERPFWRWLCSWARAIRKPSDMGFPDEGFVLPPLHVQQTIVNASRPLDGFLFSVPAVGLAEQRRERKYTLKERCEVAAADYLLLFRKAGENPIPISHPTGLDSYAGARSIPDELLKYRGWTGNQTENRFSHWIWRQYASPFWDDVRIDRVLPYEESREPDDEKHVHPLQLDVIERVIILRSNPGETILTPFMGVGSEVYGAILNDRRAIGIELKAAYYKQAVKNIEAAINGWKDETGQISFMTTLNDEPAA